MKTWRTTLTIGTMSWVWLLAWVSFSALAREPEFDLEKILQFPRDTFGRNLFFLTAYSARGSLIFATITVIFTALGALLAAGLIAHAPQRIRFSSERALDFLIAFPSLLIALAGQAVLGAGSTTLILSLGFGLLPSTTRFLLARAKEVLAEEYLTAAHALGSGRAGILRRHLAPALIDHFRLKLPFLFTQAIAVEATLSFLGLGASPGTATWGALLAQGKDHLVEAPYISVIAGTPLLLTLLALGQLEDRFGRRKSDIS